MNLIDALCSVQIQLFTWRKGVKVGTDRFGNVYYRERNPGRRRERRWVMYKGMAEASKVPAEWHGWLHYSMNEPLPEDTASRYAWQKEHLPNLTGTAAAYHPPGSVLEGGHRAVASSDYQPWTPEA